MGGEYVGQLWLFWVAPLIGAAIGGVLAQWMYEPADITDTQVVDIIETEVVDERRV